MISAEAPKYVRNTLIRLQSRGYAAYLVGGCVRDMLLGVRPNDWDICTSALPCEVTELFPGSEPTGLKHGTVTVKCGRARLEVTTFRSEDGYADHRHPGEVLFVRDLNTDLSRRDFTVNAMALSPEGFVIDPFGGRRDLAEGVIRAVGDAERRFEEDALRMLRALRFAARLGFSIEAGTLAAIEKKAALSAFLSPERVRDELEKILMTDAGFAVRLMSLGLLDSFIVSRPAGDFSLLPVNSLPKKPLMRWTALAVLLGRAGMIRDAEEFLSALRLDNRTVRCGRDCAALLSAPLVSDRTELKRLLNRYGVDTVSCAAACSDGIFGGNTQRALRSVLKSGECFSVRHLAVSGDDLLELGIRGRQLGETLAFLLDHVIEHPERNEKALLLSIMKND